MFVLNYTHSEQRCVHIDTKDFFPPQIKDSEMGAGGKSCLASRWDREILYDLFAIVYILRLLVSSDREDNAKVSCPIFHIIFQTYERSAQTLHKCSKSLTILVKLNKHACHFSLVTHGKQAKIWIWKYFSIGCSSSNSQIFQMRRFQ